MNSETYEKQLALIKQVQPRALDILKNPREIKEVSREFLKTFDINSNGSIRMPEYKIFLKCIATVIGNENEPTHDYIMSEFNYADMNKDGNLDKLEFEREVKKRLYELAGLRVKIKKI